MFKSKALKPNKLKREWLLGPENNNDSLLGKIRYFLKDKLLDIYYWPIDRFQLYKERISRSWAYAKFGWLNYDFDYSCVYYLLHFKLNRLHDTLIKGHAVQEAKDMEALKEASKIVKRLADGCYEDKYFKVHDKKWGKIQSKTAPNYDDKGKIINYTWHSWRTNTKNASDKVKNQEKKESFACYEKGEIDRRADIDRLAVILKEHSLCWWD